MSGHDPSKKCYSDGSFHSFSKKTLFSRILTERLDRESFRVTSSRGCGSWVCEVSGRFRGKLGAVTSYLKANPNGKQTQKVIVQVNSRNVVKKYTV